MTDQPTLPATPQRPGPRELARALNLIGVEQLSERIKVSGRSVSRRTLYKWFDRGAPFDSESALINWIGNHGLPIATPPPTLTQAIDQTMAQIAPSAPAGQQSSAPIDTVGLSPAGIKALSSSRLTERQTYRTDLEIAELEKVLLHRDHSVAMIKAFALETITGLTDLVPRVLRGVPSDIAGDLRQQVREALQTEITRLRTNLAELAPKLLRQVFGEEGTTP